METNPYITAIDAALAICEARLAACDAATNLLRECRDLLDKQLEGCCLDKLTPPQVEIGLMVQRLYNFTDNAPGCNNCINGKMVKPPPDFGKPCPVCAAARTDLPAALRRDIAGLQAHRDAEVEFARFRNSRDLSPYCDVTAHRAYSQRIFADCGVIVGGNE